MVGEAHLDDMMAEAVEAEGAETLEALEAVPLRHPQTHST